MQSVSAKNSKNYPQAKQHGRNALILTIINIIVTALLSIMIIAIILGVYCADYRDNYYSPYDYKRYLGKCLVDYDSSMILLLFVHFPLQVAAAIEWL